MAITPAAVSKRLQRLESSVGVRLVNRTTRKLALTDEGSAFLTRCNAILAEVEEAQAAMENRTGPLQGRLRVTAPASFGRKHIAPLLPTFMRQHPALAITLHLSDGVVDIIEDGFDVAVRIGDLADSTFVSRQIGEDHRILVAAPAYLDQVGTIETPEDLTRCNALLLANPVPQNRWTFQAKDGSLQTVRVDGLLETNNCESLREAVLAGLGVALRPTWDLGDDVRAGRMVRLLPEWCVPPLPVRAVYPGHRILSPRVRAFIDHLVSAFRGRGYWNDGIVPD
jgi:DNA-binding transcriptional LysR family regulator